MKKGNESKQWKELGEGNNRRSLKEHRQEDVKSWKTSHASMPLIEHGDDKRIRTDGDGKSMKDTDWRKRRDSGEHAERTYLVNPVISLLSTM